MAFFLLLMSTLPALSEVRQLRGIALVVGQSEYSKISSLPNPELDAVAVHELLENLGFEVIRVTNRDYKRFTRDLERFAEDAQEADVALFYYAGHGIEAAGDNWLVPVDASLNAGQSIDQELLSFNKLLQQLTNSAPLVIAFLDACRSNPFPQAPVVQVQGEATRIAKQGLGIPRGVSSVDPVEQDDIGVVVGFAASPGFPALDGKAGENSPYTSALVRHLPAMSGSEFGVVLRMIAEEVYLRTGARQRPWVNENLRKQLFFGVTPTVTDRDSALIDDERRKLLLTISEIGQEERRRVEGISKSEDVPLDLLYGVLAALGDSDRPKDVASLEVALRSQSQRIRELLTEKTLISTDDPELAKLLGSAEKALGDGAIRTARALFERAETHARNSQKSIEELEVDIGRRKTLNASILERKAQASEMELDFESATEDYSTAADWVKLVDKRLVSRYQVLAGNALQSLGLFKGELVAFRESEVRYKQALTGIDRSTDASMWAKALNNLGNTHFLIGERYPGTDDLKKSIILYREVLANERIGRGQRATSWSNLGNALHVLASRLNDSGLFEEAELALSSAISSRSLPQEQREWALDTLNLAGLSATLAERNGQYWRLSSARASTEKALSILDPASDQVARARGTTNLAIIRRIQGVVSSNPTEIAASYSLYKDQLGVFNRSSMPIDWGQANGNIAIALTSLGAITFDMDRLREALPYYERALEEITRDRAPMFWASIQVNLGLALQALGQRESNEFYIRQSIARFQDALKVRTRMASPFEWAETQRLLAFSLSSLASETGDLSLAEESIQAYREARLVYDSTLHPKEWRRASAGLSSALQGYGILKQDPEMFFEAKGIIEELLSRTKKSDESDEWASLMRDLATLQFMIGTTLHNRLEVEASIKNFDAAIAAMDVGRSEVQIALLKAMRDQASSALQFLPK